MRPTRWFDLSLRLRPATPSSGDERWWRFVHMIGDNEICVEHALGQVCATFPILGVHERAGEVLADWENSRRPVTAWLASANDGELLEPRPNHVGSRTAGEVLTILLDQQIHHGPEIALRDLHRRSGA